MKRRNIRIISILAITVSLSTGFTANALPTSNNLVMNNAEQSSAYNNAGIKAANVLLPKTSSDAAVLWAEALSQRHGAFRYAILTNDLKKQEYKNYVQNNWVIGGSSPWVVNYTVSEKNKIDDKTCEYTIDYIMSDSSRFLYNASESLTLTKLGSEWFVSKHDNYYYMPENIGMNNSSRFPKVQPRLSNDDLLPRDKESTVNLWAEALEERNGAFRYAILDKSLKDAEYDKYDKMQWLIGGSSPKVVSYKINEKNKIDDKTSEYSIDYTLTDSTKTLYYAHEDITVAQSGDDWFVTKHDNYDYLPGIVQKSLN